MIRLSVTRNPYNGKDCRYVAVVRKHKREVARGYGYTTEQALYHVRRDFHHHLYREGILDFAYSR